MKCILHIGTEKTGTTVLQEWLYSNRKALSDQGVALSNCIGKTNNRALAAFFQSQFDDFYSDRRIRTQADKDRYFKGFLDTFADEIRTLSEHHHSLVITSEHFHSRLEAPQDIQALADFLTGHFDAVRVICYFREQSELRKSSYSTALRVGVSEPILKFQRDITPASHFYNYDLMFSKWAQAFGWDNVEAALYDRSAFEAGDLRIDFLQRIDPGLDPGALDFSIETANEKLSSVQAAMIRAVNTLFPRYDRTGRVNRIRAELQRIIANDPQLKLGTIADPEQGRFYDLFDSSNHAFARKFLDRDDNPFPRPRHSAAASCPIDAGQLDEMLNAFALSILPHVGPERRLFGSDADLLRDVALKCETGAPVTRAEALELMRLAQVARPKGPVILRKIAEWQGPGIT